MNRFLLVLLSSPTLLSSLASLLVTASPVRAATPINAADNDLSCVFSPHSNGLTCIRVTLQPASTPASNPSDNDPTPMLDFTDEESDAAIAQFGCDCPACIRSLRQLRGMSPVT